MHLEASLFTAASLKKTNQFQYTLYKQEDKNEYRQHFLSDYTGLLVHDNLGPWAITSSDSIYNGPVHLSLRNNKFHSSTIATYVSDFYSSSRFTSAMALADGGPDYSPANIINMLFYFRLFKVLNFDLLSVSTYAAWYSAFNPTEHVWSPLSNHLAGKLVLTL